MIPAEPAVRSLLALKLFGAGRKSTSWTWSSTRPPPCLPDCRVAVNWAYGHILPEAAAEPVDHLTGDRASHVDMLAWDAHWYDSQGKPFDLMTAVFIDEGERKTCKPAEQIEQELAIIVANGGRYFAWDNPTAASGLVPERQEYLGRVVAPFLRARQPWCAQTERVPDAAVLNSSTDHYAATLNSPMCFAMSPKRVLGPADALCRQHLNYDVVSTARLLRGDVGAPLLVVDNPAALTADEIEAVRGWAAHRGTLLLTGTRFQREFRSGRIVRTEVPLGEHAPESLSALLARALPQERRHVVTDAPGYVEVVLRKWPPHEPGT